VIKVALKWFDTDAGNGLLLAGTGTHASLVKAGIYRSLAVIPRSCYAINESCLDSALSVVE
jgi:hypothetical protein